MESLLLILLFRLSSSRRPPAARRPPNDIALIALLPRFLSIRGGRKGRQSRQGGENGRRGTSCSRAPCVVGCLGCCSFGGGRRRRLERLPSSSPGWQSALGTRGATIGPSRIRPPCPKREAGNPFLFTSGEYLRSRTCIFIA